MKFYIGFLLNFVGALLSLSLLVSLGCSSGGGGSDSSSSSDDNTVDSNNTDDDSVQQNSTDDDSDPNATYFADSDQLAFSGGVDGTAVRAAAVLSKPAVEVVLKGTNCKIRKIDLLDSGLKLVRTLTMNSSTTSDCDPSSSNYMKHARIAIEKALNPSENAVPFFNSSENQLYIYALESTTSSSLNRNFIRTYGDKGLMNYVTRRLLGGVDGTVGTQASLHFDIRSGLPANAADKTISIDGVSIDLGVDALSNEDIAQKIAAVDFTGGLIYEVVPYEVSAQGARVTFSAKLSGTSSNGGTLAIEDNEYTAD